MIPIIKRDDLLAMLKAGENFKLVDVLSKESYDKEHIRGAVSLPLSEIETRAHEILNKKDKIVTYCASFDCQASTKAAKKLRDLGYENVLDYKGGLKDYKEGNLPLDGSLHQETPKAACSTC